MRLRACSFTLALSVLLLGGGFFAPLTAQSLADLARQEEARRKAVNQPSKVISNKDLGSVPETPESSAVAPKPSGAEPGDGAEPAKKEPGKQDTDKQEPAKKDGEVKDQAYWSGRLKSLQTQLDRDQTYADALQTRINALTADFVNRSDPAQRTVIANDKQKALDELSRLTKQVADDKKAIASLQEEARRAGIPAGWLR